MSMITVEVVYALAERQVLCELRLPQGSTARQAAERSGLDRQFDGLDLGNCPLGIFGKLLPRPEERLLEDGERVEIYRALTADPKEVRKRRAARAVQRR